MAKIIVFWKDMELAELHFKYSPCVAVPEFSAVAHSLVQHNLIFLSNVSILPMSF